MTKIIVRYTDNQEQEFEVSSLGAPAILTGDWLVFKTLKGQEYIIPSHEVAEAEIVRGSSELAGG